VRCHVRKPFISDSQVWLAVNEMSVTDVLCVLARLEAALPRLTATDVEFIRKNCAADLDKTAAILERLTNAR
jgi:hypothetical protein